MQKQNSYNYTIVGAGASGLWLAHALLRHGLLESKTLCIVESDADKNNDRTWCYWSTNPLAPDKMISKEWQQIMQLNLSNKAVNLSPYRYYHVRSADFYSEIKLALKECSAISWLQEKVTDVTHLATEVEVVTDTQKWTSDRVFLSALPSGRQTKADYHLSLQRFLKTPVQKKTDLFLWQSFVGWRVETTEKIFDARSMSMMDFDVDQGGYTQFIYELPFSDNEALIEMTRFGKEKLSKAEAEESLRVYMEKKGGNYKITEIEIGSIPMTLQFDMHRKQLSTDERIIYIGTPGGAIKPTTGFGFKRMHHYANSLAASLKNETAFPTMHRPYRFRLYDILLLQILENQPNRGKEIFEQLFRTQPIQRILKFLDEETTIIEEIAIFSRLPIRLFLRSLADHLLGR